MAKWNDHTWPIKPKFYQLLEYVDDIDILKKLQAWETFYNLHRPNSALKGKTPYEVLRENWKSNRNGLLPAVEIIAYLFF